VVFSAKGPETPQLFSRTFKVDPNTFYSGLESVSAQSFGSTYSSGSGSGGSSGGGGGGGGGGNGQNNNSGAVVGVVNAFAGAGSLRNTGNGQGGGGGGTQGQGTTSLLEGGVGGQGGVGGRGGGGGGNQNDQGGLSFITRQTSAATPSELVRAFFTSLGVNLQDPPGKAVFFNDRLGKLFVKATQDDLDTIERAIEALNEVAPQVHIKARFIEVAQDDSKALGFDWYLGQFNVNGSGSVVASGGSAPSSSVPISSANPLGAFPGNTAASVIPGSANDQWITSGLRNSAPALGTVTGILTDPNFRMVIHALEQRSGTEALAEPEVTTTSGRQTQMRATQVQSIITGFNFQQGAGATSTSGTTTGQ
jgi:type II secretory pathway component GspD/PulD (secretin)